MFCASTLDPVVICYCNLKLKQIEMSYQTVEDRLPGKMMLLHGINNNIIFYHLYYSGVYEGEAKIGSLQRYKYLFWVGTEPNNLTKQWCTLLM